MKFIIPVSQYINQRDIAEREAASKQQDSRLKAGKFKYTADKLLPGWDALPVEAKMRMRN